jgi:hypothetical protein
MKTDVAEMKKWYSDTHGEMTSREKTDEILKNVAKKFAYFHLLEVIADTSVTMDGVWEKFRNKVNEVGIENVLK